MRLADESLAPVTAEDDLYRRLLPKDHVAPDGSAVLPTAFMRKWRPDPSLSVDLAKLTTPDATLARAPRPGFGLGTLKAGVPMALGLTVRHDPLPDNYAHTLIEGVGSKEHCRRLADATTVLRSPAGDVP